MKLLDQNKSVIATGPSIEYDEAMKGWRVNDTVYTDVDKKYTAAPEFPTVGPNQFKLLFTVEEGVTAKGLRASDPVLDYFWDIIDDPRTDTVDLSLTSVQNAVEYTLTKVKAAGVTVDVPARKAAILTGVLT